MNEEKRFPPKPNIQRSYEHKANIDTLLKANLASINFKPTTPLMRMFVGNGYLYS